MELNEHEFLEELLSLRRETWENNNFHIEMNEFISNEWPNYTLDFYNENPTFYQQNYFFESSSSFQQNSDQTFAHFHHPFGDDQLSAMNPFNTNEDFPSLSTSVENNDAGTCALGDMQQTCKMEQELAPVINMGGCLDRKNRSKKLQGQPSKNLMAERRRRKRLNDRLSMLRSIVPKISKMDRTSILGDTIDYMKELIERIKKLQENYEEGSNQPNNLMNMFKDSKHNEMMIRNSPKFDVEIRNMDRRIEICCAAKPGLLLSTVNTLESLGIEIQQCVISCFNDFAMQASCSEDVERKSELSSEELKQALFRNAGYGGRCL